MIDSYEISSPIQTDLEMKNTNIFMEWKEGKIFWEILLRKQRNKFLKNNSGVDDNIHGNV